MQTLDKTFPMRQIHLDFHTGPQIPAVGSEFDPDVFGDTLARAGVTSVTVFAKCHHGHLYYETARAERHPGMKRGVALLERQVDALHKRGIRAPIYISVLCDEYAANTHPEWVARKPDTGPVKWGAGVFAPGWQIMDMTSPYQDFLVEQTAEVLATFNPVDGIFFDMCWDQPSATKWFIAGMKQAGLDPADEGARACYARQVAHAYMKRLHAMVLAASPQATVYFNARPMFNLPEDIRFLEQVEIEALPTGGWGYTYFPRNVRFARNFGKPTLGMTARFNLSWADFGGLNFPAALEYETSQMVSQGAACSIGDQLHPRGTLDKGAYALIGGAYARIAARELWLVAARPVTEVGVFGVPTGVQGTTQTQSGTDDGATRLLTQLRQQFDVLHAASDLTPYRLLVLPDQIPVDAVLAARLTAFLRNGGALLATGMSGLNAEGTVPTIPELPVQPQGLSPFTTTYMRFQAPFTAGVPDSDHVVYLRGARVLPGAGAEVVARVVEPYFERAWDHFCSHNPTPGDKVTDYAVAVVKGRVGYINFPVFAMHTAKNSYICRLLLQKLLERLLPAPLLHVDGPVGVEASLTRQEGRHIVHLLYYPALYGAVIEDIVPLTGLQVAVRLERAPKHVRLVPEMNNLPFTHAEGYCRFTVPELRGHQMIEIGTP